MKQPIAEQLKHAPNPPKQQKGFAVMRPKIVKSIASMGGKAVHAKYGSKHFAKIGKKGGRG